MYFRTLHQNFISQTTKSRDDTYKPKLLNDVTEDQPKERQHDKDKDGEKDKRGRGNDRDSDRDLKRTKDVFNNDDDDDDSPTSNKRRKLVPPGERLCFDCGHHMRSDSNFVTVFLLLFRFK